MRILVADVPLLVGAVVEQRTLQPLKLGASRVKPAGRQPRHGGVIVARRGRDEVVVDGIVLRKLGRIEQPAHLRRLLGVRRGGPLAAHARARVRVVRRYHMGAEVQHVDERQPQQLGEQHGEGIDAAIHHPDQVEVAQRLRHRALLAALEVAPHEVALLSHALIAHEVQLGAEQVALDVTVLICAAVGAGHRPIFSRVAVAVEPHLQPEVAHAARLGLAHHGDEHRRPAEASNGGLEVGVEGVSGPHPRLRRLRVEIVQVVVVVDTVEAVRASKVAHERGGGRAGAARDLDVDDVGSERALAIDAVRRSGAARRGERGARRAERARRHRQQYQWYTDHSVTPTCARPL